eukprot:GHUV01011210.1.p1 GENE.GHUV01011210.1~~GHUV01011210.1.p1  ORF type:complete len:225 (+),score=75.30 GHUV01011210.1:231-905(+)
MAVSTMSRCAPSAGATTVSRRARVHASTSKPTSFVRASRQRSVSAAAAYRAGAWNDGSADAMVNMMNDVAKAWKAAQTGSGYDYSRGRCNPCNPGSKQHSSNPNRKPSLPYDVFQNDSSYQLFVDIPGLAKPDLKIRVSNLKSDKVQGSSPRVLTISGERQAPLQEGYVQKQRLFGGFENMWELPADAESEGISAKVTDGVLIVTVPKKQQQPEVDDSQEVFIS